MARSEFQIFSFSQPGVIGVVASSQRTFGRHSHEDYGVGLIEQGAQRSASGRGLVEAGPGEIITVNPGEIHDGAPIGDAPRRWRMLYFDPACVQYAWQAGDDESPDAYEFDAPVFSDVLVARCLAELFGLYAHGSAHDALPSEERLLFVLSKLGSRRRPEARCQGFPAQVIEAKRLIDDDPAAPLTLADLARASGLSRFKTLRAFARATGFTPHAYIVQRRIDLARTLIRQGASLVDASLTSGFVDQSHMTRVFVRTYGYSPGVYAKAVG